MGIADGGDAKFRYGFGGEASPPAVWYGFRIREGESLTGTSSLIEDDSIRGSGEESEGLDGKIPVGGGTPINLHIEDHHPIFASFFGAGATPVEAPTGVYLHRYSVSQADDEFGPLWLEAWRDQGRSDLLPACVPRQIEGSLSPNGLLTLSVDWLGTRVDRYSEAVELAATGTPPVPVLRGIPNSTVRDLNDGDVYLRVSAINGAVVTFEGKVGSAAAYSNTFDVTVGVNGDGEPRWADVEDQAGDAVGTDEIPIQVHLPSTTDLTVADEWRFDAPRPEFASVLPTESAVSEVLAQIYLDGEIYEVNTLGFTMTRPAEHDEVIGGRFHPRIAQTGIRTMQWTLTRKARQSSAWFDRVLAGESVSLRLVGRGPFIGATGVRRSFTLVSMNAKATDSPVTGQVGSATNFQETVTLRAYPSTDGTYPDAATVDIVNSIAALS